MRGRTIFSILIFSSLVVTVFSQNTKGDSKSSLAALLEKKKIAFIEGSKLYNAGNYKDAKEILITCLQVQGCQIIWDEIAEKELEGEYKELVKSRKKEDTSNNSLRTIENSIWQSKLSLSLNSPRSINLILLQTRIAIEMGFDSIAKERIITAMQGAPTNTQVLLLYKKLGAPPFEKNKPVDLKSKHVISDIRANLEDIYIKLNSFRSLVKDEFETTEQFNKRFEEARQITFLGELKLGSNVDVPLESISGLSSFFSYSADESKMNLRFSFDKYPRYDFDRTVKENIYKIRIDNFEDFDFYKENKYQDDISESIYLTPEIAKDVKPNLKSLAVVRFKEPYTDNRTLLANLEEIWIYDQRTGYIYEKIKNIPNRLKIANQFYKEGKYEDSLEYLNFSVPYSLNNSNIEYEQNLLKAKNKIELKDIDWAILDLEVANSTQLLKLFFLESRPYKAALTKNKTYLTSLEKVASLVEIFPKEAIKPESFLLLAKLYQQKGNTEKSLATLNELLKIYPYLREAVAMKNTVTRKRQIKGKK